MSELQALTRALAVLPADTPVTAGMLVEKLEEAERAVEGRSSTTSSPMPEHRCSSCRWTLKDCGIRDGAKIGCCSRCQKTGGASHG